MINQERLNKALDKALREAKGRERYRLVGDHRFIIFSDHHKGARNEADDFRQCEQVYLHALDYYEANGWTLIILGDGEELWEEKPESVLAAYGDVLRSEARFHPGRYIRINGNHDNSWESQRKVRKFLNGFYPDIKVYSGLVFDFEGDEQAGELFLVHGHQGTIDSDYFAPWSRWAVRTFYRLFQIVTRSGRTTPAQDACLRGLHDTQMYNWSATKDKMILIAGHTHRPVWSSMTHLDKLQRELVELLKNMPEPPDDAYEKRLVTLREAIAEREKKYPPCNDSVKERPSYFNTGCCRFADGDITGIELEDCRIRLIKWGESDGHIARTIFEDSPLAEVFRDL